MPHLIPVFFETQVSCQLDAVILELGDLAKYPVTYFDLLGAMCAFDSLRGEGFVAKSFVRTRLSVMGRKYAKSPEEMIISCGLLSRAFRGAAELPRMVDHAYKPRLRKIIRLTKSASRPASRRARQGDHHPSD